MPAIVGPQLRMSVTSAYATIKKSANIAQLEIHPAVLQ